MKKNYIIGSLAVISLSLCSYELGRYQGVTKNESNRVTYVDQVTNSQEKAERTIEELTPEQVSAKEKIAAEQIVIKITDQGYVTSHGDHFHYYNGKVPYDAIISEELLMNDPSYQFQDADIVNEVKDGYIIKVNGRYYLYLTNKENPTNLRSKHEIEWQRHHYSQTQEKGADSATTARQQGRYRTDDGYVFHPSDIIEDVGDAYIVPHGTHFHYIPKSDLSPEELRAAQDYWNRRNQTVMTSPAPQPPSSVYPVPSLSVRQPQAPSHLSQPNQHQTVAKLTVPLGQATEEEMIDLLKDLYSLPFNQRHMEEDGLVFDPMQMTNRTEHGVVVPHGNHYHFIPYSSLSALEQKIAKRYPIGRRFVIATKGSEVEQAHSSNSSRLAKPIPQPQPSQPVPSPSPNKPSTDKLHTLLAPKKEVSVAYKDFYQATYRLLASALDQQADQATYDQVNPFIKQLNEEPADKVGLTRKILTCLSLLRYPERIGKPNSQIAYTPQELQVAALAGMYTTSDGYIFDAKDIMSDEGEGYLAPHMEHSHYIPKTDLSTREQEEARRYVEETDLKDKKEEATPPLTAERAIDIYERVEAAKLIPVADMPYHAAYAVDFINGKIIIPHRNHYHNIPLYVFDTGLYEVPKGYTLEQFLATVKYYVLHPEDRPGSDDGYGMSSDHGKSLESDQDGEDGEEDSDDEASSDDEDGEEDNDDEASSDDESNQDGDDVVRDNDSDESSESDKHGLW